MSILKRTSTALAALLLSLAGALVFGNPAYAAEEDCPETNSPGYVCLWKWVGFEGGRWQQKLDTLATLPASGTRPAGCWNLSGSTFGSPHAGSAVNNESASLVIEPSSISGMRVIVYDWVDCNPNSLIDSWLAYNRYTAVTNLTTVGGYHNITSIKVIY